MSADLRRDFGSRDELVAYCREQFSEAVDPDHVSATRGGRRAAEEALGRIQPARYARTRNHVDGAVTRLSPYLRHGVLSLPEVRDAALAKAARGSIGKFVNELGWRDYWQRIYAREGDGVWEDQEDYKTGLQAEDYEDELAGGFHGGEDWAAVHRLVPRGTGRDGLSAQSRSDVVGVVFGPLAPGQMAGGGAVVPDAPAGRRSGEQQSVVAMGREHVQSQAVLLQPGESGAVYERGALRVCPLYGRCDFEGTYARLERKLFPLPRAADE